MRLDRAIDQLSRPMVLRLLSHHECAPLMFGLSAIAFVGDRRGNGNGADFQPADAIECDIVKRRHR